MDSRTTKASSAKVLLKKIAVQEVQGLEKNKTSLASASNLDQLLNGVYTCRSPKQIEYDNRMDLVRIFNAILKEIYGDCSECPSVEGFGSFVMGMFSSESDLDLSINFRNNVAEVPREKKIQTLRKLAKKLYSIQREGHVYGIQTIMTARVPIVKVIDCGTGIECDVSVDNRDGIEKSLIIRAISTIDERFQKLSFLMKAWAKAHDINSSRERTLNSLSLISLVALHLQTRDPPILPSFSALLKDGNDPTAVMKMIQNYLNYGERNTESLAELFISLLIKLASVEKLWQEGLCVSLCVGSWISKHWDSGIYAMSVEDFTDQSQNVARAVTKDGFDKIHGCIRRSLSYLEAFSNGQIQGTELKELLFGRDTICRIGDSVATNLDKNTTEPSVSNSSNQIKRKMQLPGDLGVENIGKTFPVEARQKRKRQFTDGLDEPKGAKRGKGAQLLDRREGVQFMEGGRKQPVENWAKPVSISGWEGKHPVGGQFGENRGHLTTPLAPQGPYLVPLSHSLDILRSLGPVMFPSMAAPNFTDSQGLCNLIPQPLLVSMLNALGLNVSDFQNRPAPIPNRGPIPGQHAQHQPHTIPRGLRW